MSTRGFGLEGACFAGLALGNDFGVSVDLNAHLETPNFLSRRSFQNAAHFNAFDTPLLNIPETNEHELSGPLGSNVARFPNEMPIRTYSDINRAFLDFGAISWLVQSLQTRKQRTCLFGTRGQGVPPQLLVSGHIATRSKR